MQLIIIKKSTSSKIYSTEDFYMYWYHDKDVAFVHVYKIFIN